jgi:hypothetical protein
MIKKITNGSMVKKCGDHISLKVADVSTAECIIDVAATVNQIIDFLEHGNPLWGEEVRVCRNCKWWDRDPDMSNPYPDDWRECTCHMVEETTTGTLDKTNQGFGCVWFEMYTGERKREVKKEELY